MKRLLIAVVLIGMFGWTIYSFAFQSNDPDIAEVEDVNAMNQEDISEENASTETTVGLEVGNLAPDFHLATLNGEEIALSNYRGRTVMINFWATWCPPCRAEMPDMEQFYRDTDIEILAINLTETEPNHDQVQRFVDEYEITFPILMDEVIEVATTYAIQPIPTSFVIDSEGIIQFKTFGPLTYDQMVEVFNDID